MCMNIYRLKLFTSVTQEFHNGDQEYCLNNNFMAIGWGYENGSIRDVNHYIENATQDYLDSKNFKVSYGNLEKIQKNDLIWTKVKNKFYIGKITDEKPFIDAQRTRIGLIRQCVWKEIPFNQVPGKIIRNFRVGCTLITIIDIDDNFKLYCNSLYENNSDVFKPMNMNYKDLLHPDDLEDLLGLYLQDGQIKENGIEKKYFIIPSTNKTSTKMIEYELRTKEGEKACVQCKTGKDVVGDEIFNVFKDYHIYISTNNNHCYDDKGNNVTTIYTDDLWKWAIDNQNLLSDRVRNWIKLCEVKNAC